MREREGESIVKCPHPESRCPKSFHSVLHLRFHLEDIHGIPMGKDSKAKANRTSEKPVPSEKRPKVKKERPRSSCLFINNTATTMRTSSRRISKTPSSSSTSSYPLKSDTQSENRWSGSETPLLSGSSDAIDDLASDLDFVVIDAPDTDFVMINELDTSAKPLDYQMPVMDSPLEGDKGLQETLQHTTIELEYESVISSLETSNRPTPSCLTEGLGYSSAPSSYSTPVSSACSEDLIDQPTSPLNGLGLAAIELVDLTDTENILQPSHCNPETSEGVYFPQ